VSTNAAAIRFTVALEVLAQWWCRPALSASREDEVRGLDCPARESGTTKLAGCIVIGVEEAVRIEDFSFGHITIGGVSYEHDVVVADRQSKIGRAP
jgi:hypothetical protein